MQDGRRLRRYTRRWLVERFFAWIQWQRRILVHQEFYPKNFLWLRATRLPRGPLQTILK
jgi:hypothetical protein